MNVTNLVATKNIERELNRIQSGLNTMKVWYFISLYLITLAASMMSGCGRPQSSAEYIDSFMDQGLTDINYVRVERDIAEINRQLDKLGYVKRNWPIAAYYINSKIDDKYVGQSQCFKWEKICVVIVMRQLNDALSHELIHSLVKEETGDHHQKDLWAETHEKEPQVLNSLEFKMLKWEQTNNNQEWSYP